MRKRTMVISLICILLAVFTMIIFVFASGRKPYKDLEAAQIVSATVQLSPPDKTIQITETKELVVRTGNPCAYFRSISPIAQVKKPRRSTTTSAFFDLHSRKNILRNMHKDFRYGLLESLLLSKYLTVETVKADGNLFTIGGAVMKSFDDKAGTIFCTELRDRH